MAQAGTQVCLVIAIVLSVCAHMSARVYLYVAQSLFIELLPGKTRGGAPCTQDTRADWFTVYIQHIFSGIWALYIKAAQFLSALVLPDVSDGWGLSCLPSSQVQARVRIGRDPFSFS